MNRNSDDFKRFITSAEDAEPTLGSANSIIRFTRPLECRSRDLDRRGDTLEECSGDWRGRVEYRRMEVCMAQVKRFPHPVMAQTLCG